MGNRGIQQEVIVKRLPLLLLDVYQGRLRVPSSAQPSWDDERRLRLFDAIYRGLPVGSLSVLRTTAELDYHHSLGGVPLQELAKPSRDSAHDYLVAGRELVTTLFAELGRAFWRADGRLRRRLLGADEDRSSWVFDMRAQVFSRRLDGPVRPTEYPLRDLFDAEAQHAFSGRLRGMSEGERLANRLVHLVDAFFDYAIPIITIASEDAAGVQSALSLRLTLEAPLRKQSLETICWYCDTCKQRIEQPRDGWVEWLVRREGSQEWKMIGHGLRLVHHQPASPLPQGCQYDDQQEFSRDRSQLRDLPLEDFLGPDGLTRLVSLLQRGELPQDEVIEMIKRLHSPGYERARFHIPDAIAAGVIDPNLPEGLYWQREIAKALEWADKEGRKP